MTVENGDFVYSNETYVHTIQVYIYEPIKDVTISSALVADLYLADSLGYFDKDLSYNTIVSTYAPDEKRLGAEWNQKFKDMLPEPEGEDLAPVAFDAVKKIYDLSMLDTAIRRKNGSPIVLSSRSNEVPNYTIHYGDIFVQVGEQTNYQIKFQSVLSEEIKNWFEAAGYTSENEIKMLLVNQVFYHSNTNWRLYRYYHFAAREYKQKKHLNFFYFNSFYFFNYMSNISFTSISSHIKEIIIYIYPFKFINFFY